MKKRKSPTEIIEARKEPWFEDLYIKFPGKKLINATTKKGFSWIISNEPKIKELVQRYGKRYTEIHTHPVAPGAAFPSQPDIKRLLMNKDQKTEIIAQQYYDNGKVGGYIILRKTKNTQNPEQSGGYKKLEKLYNEENWGKRYFRGRRSHTGKMALNSLDRIAKIYHLKYKIIPTKGFELNRKYGMFVKTKNKSSDLENAVSAIIALAGLGSALIFLSSNLTGNVIGNMTSPTSNILGAVLLIIGLISGFFWIKNRKK